MNLSHTQVEAASNKSHKNKSSKKKSKKKRVKKPKPIKCELHYLVGWGNEAVTAGIGYTKALSSGGFWRLETSFNTAIGDETLGAQKNAYSVNALLTMNVTFFRRLRLSLKGGPAIRHQGLGVDATNEYYNYGGTISLDLDKRGVYGLFYYADAIGMGYVKKF